MTTNLRLRPTFTRGLGRVRNRVQEKLQLSLNWKTNSTTHYTTLLRVICAKLGWNVFPGCPACIKSVTLLLTAMSVEKTVITFQGIEVSKFVLSIRRIFWLWETAQGNKCTTRLTTDFFECLLLPCLFDTKQWNQVTKCANTPSQIQLETSHWKK